MKEKTMTKLIVAMGVFTLVATIIIICAMYSMTSTSKDYLYPLTTIVIEINEDENTVACEDYDGNVWEFYGIENWKEGDLATLLMDACDVSNDYDDEIVEIRYGGNVKGFE